MNEQIYDNFAGDPVMKKLRELYNSLLVHEGFGEIRIDMRILKKGQKEVIVHCGKQYRYVVDVLPSRSARRAPVRDIDAPPARKEVQ